MRLWHYTVDLHYNNIAKDGFIKQAFVGIDENEKPAVWLSSNPDYEKSVRKTLINQKTGAILNNLSRDELFSHDVQSVRIEINPLWLGLLNWEEFKKQSGISQKSVDHLEALSKEWGANPSEWYACFNPINEKDIIGVEVWDGKRWKAKYRNNKTGQWISIRPSQNLMDYF